MTVGERLRETRKRAGLTQAELAEKSGVAAISIHQYESGKRRPQLEQLGKIAIALQTTVFEIMGPDWSGIDMTDAFSSDGTTARAVHDPRKNQLDAAYDRLNDKGQQEAVKRVEELAEIPRYRKEKNPATEPQEGK